LSIPQFDTLVAVETVQATAKAKRRPDWKKIGFILWTSLLLLLLAIHWYPIRFGTLRLLLVVGVVTLWLGALWLVWQRKPLKRALIVVSILCIAFLLAPARPLPSQSLRQEYVRALKSYEGTTYVWGGESKRGIDCSGLMRCALIDANIKQGIKSFNASGLREGFSLWWNDSSAKALKEEYQGKTAFRFTAPNINQVNYAAIQPGDMAVTSSGVHVLAYVGEQTWIEADPNEIQGNRVIQVKTPTRNAWFNMPVHIMRWRQLQDGSDKRALIRSHNKSAA
jgi:hypothetical protein